MPKTIKDLATNPRIMKLTDESFRFLMLYTLACNEEGFLPIDEYFFPKVFGTTRIKADPFKEQEYLARVVGELCSSHNDGSIMVMWSRADETKAAGITTWLWLQYAPKMIEPRYKLKKVWLPPGKHPSDVLMSGNLPVDITQSVTIESTIANVVAQARAAEHVEQLAISEPLDLHNPIATVALGQGHLEKVVADYVEKEKTRIAKLQKPASNEPDSDADTQSLPQQPANPFGRNNQAPDEEPPPMIMPVSTEVIHKAITSEEALHAATQKIQAAFTPYNKTINSQQVLLVANESGLSVGTLVALAELGDYSELTSHNGISALRRLTSV